MSRKSRDNIKTSTDDRQQCDIVRHIFQMCGILFFFTHFFKFPNLYFFSGPGTLIFFEIYFETNFSNEMYLLVEASTFK